MKTNLFTIQVLGLIVFIPAFVIMEFNHNKSKPLSNQATAVVKKTSYSPIQKQATDRDIVPNAILFVSY